MSNKPRFLLQEWKTEVIPGLYFLSIEPALAVYGKILHLQQNGFLWTLCYHEQCPSGEESKLHYEDLTVPLSLAQYQIAKKLKWPSDELGLTEVLTLPSD